MLFPIAIELGNNDTAFGVVVPDIEGCYSAGDTAEEAILNAKEAIELHLEALADDKAEIPQASSFEDFAQNKEYEGWIFSLIEIDMTPFLGLAHKINVTLPDILLKKIDHKVGQDSRYKSRSGFIQEAAIKQLSA